MHRLTQISIGTLVVGLLGSGMIIASGCGDDGATDGVNDAGDGTADGPGDSDAGTPPAPAFGCPPLPAPGPEQTIIDVDPSMADALPDIVRNATSGTTIRLADGTYLMSAPDEGNRRLQFRNPGVTLRSASGDRDAVVIDGEYMTNEMLFISADDVTIADITITRAVDHPIHVTGSEGSTRDTLLYNLRIIDGGEQFVKVNSDGDGNYVDDGVLACSYLELTPTGRTMVEPNPGGCYTGGIDAHGAWGWQVRDNTFVDIYCDNGSLAEHAVHFWSASRDTLVERNTIINCARGVGFGLVEMGADRTYPDDPYPGVGYIGHYDGIIRNNVIHADIPYFDTGIELDQARGSVVVHNTIAQPASAFSSIDYRFANTSVTIRNNIVRNITVRNGADGTVESNLETDVATHFVDPASYDYHLLPTANEAIDNGVAVPEAGLDIDGESHDNGAPDLGADEVQ